MIARAEDMHKYSFDFHLPDHVPNLPIPVDPTGTHNSIRSNIVEIVSSVMSKTAENAKNVWHNIGTKKQKEKRAQKLEKKQREEAQKKWQHVLEIHFMFDVTYYEYNPNFGEEDNSFESPYIHIYTQMTTIQDETILNDRNTLLRHIKAIEDALKGRNELVRSLKSQFSMVKVTTLPPRLQRRYNEWASFESRIEEHYLDNIKIRLLSSMPEYQQLHDDFIRIYDEYVTANVLGLNFIAAQRIVEKLEELEISEFAPKALINDLVVFNDILVEQIIPYLETLNQLIYNFLDVRPRAGLELLELIGVIGQYGVKILR